MEQVGSLEDAVGSHECLSSIQQRVAGFMVAAPPPC
jgi:hypothetical protein